MTRLLIASLMMMGVSAFAALRVNLDTGIYYYQGQNQDVNQVEYNNLMIYSTQFITTQLELVDEKAITHVFVPLYASLRMIGTPTAIALIEDLQAAIEEAKSLMLNLDEGSK